jgi:hypothetical protein
MFDYEPDKESRIGWQARAGGFLMVICFVILICCLGYAFKYPDKTHTRLFLDLWWLELPAILCGLIGGLLIQNASEE